MSEDGPNRDRKKEHPIRTSRAGRELLDWLTPTRSSSREQPDTASSASGQTLNRRRYMMLAGGAASAVVAGTTSASASPSGDDAAGVEFGQVGYGKQPYGGIDG